MRRYGKWAGEPKGREEDPNNCIVEVAEGGRSVLFHQCYRSRGCGQNGAFCFQHAKKIATGWEPWIPDE